MIVRKESKLYLIYNNYIVHVVVIGFQRVFVTLHTLYKIFVEAVAIILVLCDERFQDEPETLLNDLQLTHHRMTREFGIVRKDRYRKHQHVIG